MSKPGRRSTIAFLETSLTEARRSPVWGELADICRDRGTNLRVIVGGALASPIGFEAQGNVLYRLVNAGNTDGLIVTGGLGHYVGADGLRHFCEDLRPLALVSLEVRLDRFPSVVPDFYAGMASLMRHLIADHGYRRIAFIRGPSDSKTGEDRYRAYCDSLAEAGLPFDPDLVAPGTFFSPSGAAAVSLLLDKRKVTFEALVAANDIMAVDALRALKERGVGVPSAIALAGFDNREIVQAVQPPLTTVELPTDKEVRVAADVIQRLLRGEDVPLRIDIETEVVLRQSCGCASAALQQLAPRDHSRAAASVLPEALPVGSDADAVFAWPAWLATSRPAVLAEMAAVCRLPRGEDLAPLEAIWDAFAEDLFSGRDARLMAALEELACEEPCRGMDPSEWQAIISAHRRHTQPLLLGTGFLQQAESLWQRARVFLAERALILEAQRQFAADQLNATLLSVGERLVTAFDLSALMEAVARELPRLGIPACYIALYEGGGALPAESRLTLAYNEAGRLPLGPEGLVFPTASILPEQVLPAGRSFTHLLLSLHFHDQQLGYVVFEPGPRNAVIYETLALHLSTALKGALLVEEMQKARESALQAKALAERADQLKTRLLANVTHELRTPLNVILGYSRMALLDPNPHGYDLPPGLRNDLENVRGSAEHLMRLISDLLDLSRAEIGELDLYPEPVTPRAFLEQAFSTMAESVGPNPALAWRLELPPRLPIIMADPTRLRQIALNLLSNAHKFTESGEIVLGAEVVPPHLHIWVRDTGYGIPIERQERVFEPFFTEGYASRRPEGIGLGLTITRQLVALHGGSLSLESQPGHGSVFHVYLPLPNLSGRLRVPPVRSSESARPGLFVISSNEGFATEMTALAAPSRWTVCRIASQAELSEALAGTSPAAIMWDISRARPGQWALVQHLRSHPQMSHVPFILYHKEAGESLRLTNILLKPLNSSLLADLIQSLQPPTSGGAVLVVDDDPQARDLYARLLADRFPGFPIVAVEDGQAALDWLQSEAPSLVILDLSMPRVDGFTVLERLRADARTRTTPVFVLTGRMLSYEDIKRLDYPQVVAHSKGILSDEETLAGVERVFAGSHLVAQPTSLVVKQALGYMQRNYPHTLSRGEISAAVGVSEDYLSRIFSRETGLSPWEYLNRIRVLQAKRLLADSRESVTWIAAQVGFDDPAYFSRVFQKLEGCSPREFRARAEAARHEPPAP
ncbi:MAG: substrate-binding domain-containing protein [Anaerolineae bacterium]|nr:substrate-binding domain-containing protein [Anaerolineae bacterium]